MLDSTGYRDRHVDLGTDGLSGLADLTAVGRVSVIDRLAAGAPIRLDPLFLQGLNQVFDQFKVIQFAARPSSGDDDLGGKKALPADLFTVCLQNFNNEILFMKLRMKFGDLAFSVRVRRE